MELPSKQLEQTIFNSTHKVEGHMLIIKDRSTHEEKLSQRQENKNKQF